MQIQLAFLTGVFVLHLIHATQRDIDHYSVPLHGLCSWLVRLPIAKRKEKLYGI
jgi:hypothetical protein